MSDTSVQFVFKGQRLTGLLKRRVGDCTTEQTTYYRPTKLDYLDDAATSIDDEVRLALITIKMKPYQIRAVSDEFEDPYSSFNYDREYSEYYWSRFKKAVAEAKPDVILM